MAKCIVEPVCEYQNQHMSQQKADVKIQMDHCQILFRPAETLSSKCRLSVYGVRKELPSDHGSKDG